MMPRLASLILGLALAFTAGCQSTKAPRDYTPQVARFFLESTGDDGTPLMLPQSGVRLTVSSKPVFTEGDILNVELVQVELGRCLMFQLTPSATRDLYRLTVAHQGRRLALFINDHALGARRIDGPISSGTVYIFVEVPEPALPALVENLKKTSDALQREIARKG